MSTSMPHTIFLFKGSKRKQKFIFMFMYNDKDTYDKNLKRWKLEMFVLLDIFG